jgi:hypothetical protein
VLNVKAKTGDRTLSLSWDRGRSFDKDVAQMFLNRVKQQSVAK